MRKFHESVLAFSEDFLEEVPLRASSQWKVSGREGAAVRVEMDSGAGNIGYIVSIRRRSAETLNKLPRGIDTLNTTCKIPFSKDELKRRSTWSAF